MKKQSKNRLLKVQASNLANGCIGKISYKREEDAWSAARHTNKRKVGMGRGKLGPYFCVIHMAYHIGNHK